MGTWHAYQVDGKIVYSKLSTPPKDGTPAEKRGIVAVCRESEPDNEKERGIRMYKNFNVGDKVIVKGKITDVLPTKGSHDVLCVVKLEDGDMIRKDQTYLYPYDAAEITQKNDEIATPSDNINHPAHYTAGKVECIDALESATVNLTGIEAVCTANAIKYLWRWKRKNGVEDLQKARWYIERLIKEQEDLKQ